MVILSKWDSGKQKHILLFFYLHTQQAIIEKHFQIIKLVMITDDERLQTAVLCSGALNLKTH